MQSQLSLQFLFGIKWLHCATLHFVNLITCSLPQCSKSTVGNLLHLDSFTCHAILLHPNLENYSAAFIEKISCSALWSSDSRYWPHLCCTASCQGWPRSWKRTSMNFETSICHILHCNSSPVVSICIHKEIHAVSAWTTVLWQKKFLVLVFLHHLTSCHQSCRGRCSGRCCTGWRPPAPRTPPSPCPTHRTGRTRSLCAS